MKKLSEVCKIIGVTRRTLQEYARIDLLQPTLKDDKYGYWYYDDIAIRKLILIKIFVEADYKRKDIKAILESPTLDMSDIFDCLTESLEKKRKEIDGMLNTIKAMKITESFPESMLCALENIDVARLYKDKSFDACLKEIIIESSDNTDVDNEEAEIQMPFWYSIIAIGCLQEMSEHSEQVQAAVKYAYTKRIELMKASEEDSNDELAMKESPEGFLEELRDLIEDSEFVQIIDLHCGDGAASFIVRATQVFCKKTKDVTA